MHELTGHELYQALEYAKSIDENTGRTIIERFQLEQTAFAQTILAIFPSIIAQENQEMSYLFMDLCFDVLCVFQQAFGPLPSHKDVDKDRLEKQTALLEAELQALNTNQEMDEKIRKKLQDRLANRIAEDNQQTGLIDFLNEVIDDYASENPHRISAIPTTKAMILNVVRLFGNLYSHAVKDNA
ncbi:MAG: hypothetical protein ACXWT3_11200 [Methylococcaceae bacterium]